MASLTTSSDIGTFLASANKSAARTNLDLGNAALATTSTGGNGAADSGKVAAYGFNGTFSCSAGVNVFNGASITFISAANITGGKTNYFPNADGTYALTASTTGIPDSLANGTISGTLTINSTTYTYGTGAAAAHRTALGAGAAGDAIFTSATKSAAQTAAGFVTITPANYAALVAAGTTDANTIYIVQE